MLCWVQTDPKSKQTLKLKMADTPQVSLVKHVLETMTGSELKRVKEHVFLRRNKLSCRFLELPPELRNRIYRLCITPDVVEAHARRGQAPTLLKINHQISSEFEGLYYSMEFMNAELYNPSTRAWEAVKEANTFRAMLGRWYISRVDSMYKTLQEEKRFIVLVNRSSGTAGEKQYFYKRGIFTWPGAPPNKALSSSCSSDSITMKMEERKWRRQH